MFFQGILVLRLRDVERLKRDTINGWRVSFTTDKSWVKFWEKWLSLACSPEYRARVSVEVARPLPAPRPRLTVPEVSPGVPRQQVRRTWRVRPPSVLSPSPPPRRWKSGAQRNERTGLIDSSPSGEGSSGEVGLARTTGTSLFMS